MDLELWQVATRIREDPDAVHALADQPRTTVAQAYRERTLPPVAQRGIAGFLRRYGHRAVAEIDLGVPRWAEDPSHIIGMIANYLRLTDPELAPPVQFRRGQQAAEAMITELVDRAARHGRPRAWLIDFALRRARRLIGLRESPKYLLIVALSTLRTHLLQVGRVLVDQGRLTAADDIFFLDYAEARRALNGERFVDLVTERRAAYAVELRRRHVPRLLVSDGTEPEAVATPAVRSDGALAGSPASAGTVTGPARVVLDPVGAHLEPGEILVAPSTDPGWTPLFLTAGGLVMEMGGSNSHGAVVAREYGIPAVVGVPEATSRIETGQLITVDGASGLVTVS
jgi:pyruvate,water dikinase